MMLWGECQIFHPLAPHGGFHHRICPFFLLFCGLKRRKAIFTRRPIHYFFIYIFATRRFGTLSKVCHTGEFNGVSYFMVPKREIISYVKIVYKSLIILEGVKLRRSLLVPIYELRERLSKCSKSDGVRVKTQVSLFMSMNSSRSSLVLFSSVSIVNLAISTSLKGHSITRVLTFLSFDLEPQDIDGSRSQKDFIHASPLSSCLRVLSLMMFDQFWMFL